MTTATTATDLNRTPETVAELDARMERTYDLIAQVDYTGPVRVSWERAVAHRQAGEFTRAARLTSLAWRAALRRGAVA